MEGEREREKRVNEMYKEREEPVFCISITPHLHINLAPWRPALTGPTLIAPVGFKQNIQSPLLYCYLLQILRVRCVCHACALCALCASFVSCVCVVCVVRTTPTVLSGPLPAFHFTLTELLSLPADIPALMIHT